ncbi:MAG: hypothetical protein A2107_00615 [Verrucomicrobia bacterium GWF2_62_7]|nr:MAG: hypothetical protein A2107_00615 [Verrucomicrobia bacterium GWF2_62_7]
MARPARNADTLVRAVKRRSNGADKSVRVTNSKHIPSGEGGAVTGMSDELLDRCHSFHNCGRSVGSFKGSGCFARGSNYRMQHFQAVILLQQFEKLLKETEIRRANADYLTAGLNQIGGIAPARLPENSRTVGTDRRAVRSVGCLRRARRSRPTHSNFNGLSRGKFIHALGAEGVPCGGGYGEQYNDGMLDEAINSPGYKRLWSADRLKAYRESFKDLKGNAQVCATTVGMGQTLLLADRSAMDHILEAIRKIRAYSAALAKGA